MIRLFIYRTSHETHLKTTDSSAGIPLQMVEETRTVPKYTQLLKTEPVQKVVKIIAAETTSDLKCSSEEDGITRQSITLEFLRDSIDGGKEVQERLEDLVLILKECMESNESFDEVIEEFQLSQDPSDLSITNDEALRLATGVTALEDTAIELKMTVICYLWKISELSENNKAMISDIKTLRTLLMESFQVIDQESTPIRDLLKSAKLEPIDLLQLFGLFKNTADRRYLDLLDSLLDKEYDSHFNFKNSSITFQTTPKILNNSYTIQTWVRGSSLQDNELFLINANLLLKFESSMLAVYYRNKLVGSFDTYQFEDATYYHIVLIHVLQNHNSEKAKLRLYVNGQYIQKLKCPLPFHIDDAFKESNSLSVKIGCATQRSIDITNLLVAAGTQSFEWILLSYYLGRSYSGNYQDSQILKCLNYEERAQFNLKLLDSTNNRQGEYDIQNLNITISKDDLILNFNSQNLKSSFHLFAQDSVLKVIPDTESSPPTLTLLGEVSFYQNESFSELFYAISSLQLVLTLIEEANDMNSLHTLVKFFLKLINQNWKFIQEAESNNYFNILSRILRFKKAEFKQNFTLELFDIFLGFVGFNFQSPFNSVINNHLAYDIFIFDFQLWRPFSSDNTFTPEDTEILEFLVFQITVFCRECKYANFNTIKLKKLKVIKTFLNALSQGFLPEKLNDAVYDSLSTLVKGNLTQETVASLSSFVIYSLNEKNTNVGVLVLKVLAEFFLDPLFSSASYWKKLFSSCSVKWILLLLDLGKDSKFVFDIGISFLLKIFTISRKTFEVFVRNNGLSALLSTMRDITFDEVEVNLLIKGTFGQYSFTPNFEKLRDPLVTTTLTTVEFHELNYLILDSLEWTVLNDIFTEGGHAKILRMLNLYSEFVNTAVQENASFQNVSENDLIYIRKICNMILLLTKPTNASMYFESSQKYISILSNIIITKFFNNDTTLLETFLLSILKIDSNSGVQSDPISIVFLSLIFPQVLIHLKGFSTEFPILLETNGIKFSNIAIFLSLLHNELLCFEWNSTDYMNYFSVFLDIIEAYKHTSKSKRNSYYIQLVKSITSVINAFVCVLRFSTSQEQEENFLKVLMFHQENLFTKENLTNDGVSNLIGLLLQIAAGADSDVANLSLNCLRMILMQRQEDLSSICSCITFRNFLPVSKFLTSVTSWSDEDVISNFLLDGKIKGVFDRHMEALSNKVDKRYNKDSFESSEDRINRLIKKFDDSVKTKYELLDALSSSYKNDNEALRLKIVSNETMRAARYTQDQQDNLQFYLSEYNKLKFEINKIIKAQSAEEDSTRNWILDNMEGIDRMRKVLLPYDEIETDKRLNSVLMIPARKVGKDGKDVYIKPETQSLKSFEFIEADVIDDSLNTYNDRNRKVLKCLFPGDKIHELWNVSQVVGLDIIEGVLILGKTHLYIIQNYFHKAQNDEIIDIDEASEEERDPNIKLITGQPTGETRAPVKNLANRHSVQTWDLLKLTSVTKRRFLLRDVALELFFSNGGSFLITAIRTKERDVIFSKLSSVATNSNIDNDLSNIFKETNLNSNTFGSTSRNFTTKLANVFGAEYLSYLDATKKWQNGEMSNFYYLMIVNTFAGRTFNDLTQYPVFPWVIADYSSDDLDLNDPNSFRDLSKPMGAQSPARAQQFKERYEALQSLCNDDAPAFHYGTHYSSAMIVASFLIRLEPYVQSYLLLQGGKFDHPDRLFSSIMKTWKSASMENTTDVRELIPEFYFLPEFLTNINCYEFGKLQDGTEVSDVELPKWARGDPKIFIAKNREALESPYVSEHLHEWIDLIFGFKQTGPESVESINVFNHLSYRGAIDLDSINNEDERRSITGIIHNFGQTPTQIFNKPHPKRDINAILSINPNQIRRNPSLIYQTKFKEPIQFLHSKQNSDNSGDVFWRGYPGLHLSGEIEIKRGSSSGSLIINRQTFERLHDDEITTLAKFDNETLLTGSKSGVIHIWKYLVVIKGFNENLEFETRLRAHTSAIKELKVSPKFNILLSLDVCGNCYLWDLSRYKLIRKLTNTNQSKPFEHIAIAYDSGMICASYGSSVKIFNVNGSLNFVGRLSTSEEQSESITALSFANSRSMSTVKMNNIESHEFWKYIALITTGWSNGIIKIHELKITRTYTDEESNSWGLLDINEMKFQDGKIKVANEEVTIVESYLKSYVNYEEMKVGKIEVVAGDVNGRVAVWRQ